MQVLRAEIHQQSIMATLQHIRSSVLVIVEHSIQEDSIQKAAALT